MIEPRAARVLLLLTLLLLAFGSAPGCSSLGSGDPTVEEPRPLAAPPPPAPIPGDSLDAVLATIEVPSEGAKLDLHELQLLRVDVDPWERVSPDEAPGDVVMMAVRRCNHREGLFSDEAVRASWYVFESGRLRVFDHSSFDGHCGVRRIFTLSPPERPEPERTLVRWVSQRHPDDLADSADKLRLGIALVEAGRLDEAERWLESGSREVERLESRTRIEGDDDEIEKDRRLDELRPLRATLTRELRDARKALEAASAEADQSLP
ncbi:MAG: hypothetical protein QNK05_03115 [Myxococcota bacterium]|nr:hypothetical protein [Myxococcota bacterium]